MTLKKNERYEVQVKPDGADWTMSMETTSIRRARRHKKTLHECGAPKSAVRILLVTLDQEGKPELQTEIN